jgi:signal transduction histidine kinase
MADKSKAAAQERWQALFDQAPGFICILRGPDHVFDYANKRYLELIGERDIIGRPVRLALPEIEPQGFFELLDDVYNSGHSHAGVATPVVLERSPSEVRYVDFVYQAVRNSAGEISGVFVHGFDVTERVLAALALQAADRRKNEFLAMLAHELRNPLAAIRNAAEVVSVTAPPQARVPEMIAVIKRQATLLSHLVDDLLDVSRVSQGRIQLRLERLDLISLVSQAVEVTQPDIDAKRHRLSVAAPGEPVFIRADRTRMVQSIANVLINAAKYTDPGGKIQVKVRCVGKYAEVAITDNGVGLAAEILPHVFDIFVQGRMSLDRAQGGLGIGLSLVKHLLGLHGGEVAARSKGVGMGSTFYLRVPLADAAV